MGASVHITLRGGPEQADATAHAPKEANLIDQGDDRTTSPLRGRHQKLVAIHHDYEAWETQRGRCSSLDFAQDPSAPSRWAANEDLAVDLLRRLARYHGW